MSNKHNIKVLFASDGSSLKMDLSLQTTLEQLKTQISKEKHIEPKFQRLFHLGRELKNCRRSLNALGIGNFNSFVIHLQSNQPKDYVYKDIDDDDDDNVTATIKSSSSSSSSSSQQRRKRKRNDVITNNNSSNSNNVINLANDCHNNSGRRNVSSRKEIVDLLDSDSDDNDDEIEVVEVKQSRR